MDKKRTFMNDMTHETDRLFLDRSGVSSQIQEVLTKVIENRPEDPVSFIADYFETLGDKVDRVSKANQQICLTHYTKPAFQNNVRIAYDLLSQTKVGRQLKGINGGVYSELLNSLCVSFPSTIRERLLKKIQCREYEVVLFEIFKSGIFTVMVLKDFVKQSDMLFKSLDTSNSGRVDRALCEVVIQQLMKAVSNSSSTNPKSVLDAGYLLGPDKLYTSIASALFSNKSGAQKSVMSGDEFVACTAETFLSKVHTLK